MKRVCEIWRFDTFRVPVHQFSDPACCGVATQHPVRGVTALPVWGHREAQWGQSFVRQSSSPHSLAVVTLVRFFFVMLAIIN